MFLHSIYHQRAGETNLFHMRGGRLHAFNTWCTIKLVLDICNLMEEENVKKEK